MLAVRGCASARSVVNRSDWWSSLQEPRTTRHAHAVILPHDLFCFGVPHVVRGSERWLLLMLFGARSWYRRPRVFCGHVSGHGVCEMVTIRMRVCHSAFCVRPERLVRLSPLLIAVLGVSGMLQTHSGKVSLAVYSDVLQPICDGVIVSEN